MSHGPNNGHLVGKLCLLRHQLGEVDTRQACLNGAKRTAKLGGGFWLGIVRFQLAGTTIQPDQDHAFVVLLRSAFSDEALLRCQIQTGDTQKTGLKNSAATTNFRALNLQHRSCPAKAYRTYNPEPEALADSIAGTRRQAIS